MHTILIVDDHAILRKGVIRSLEDTHLGISCDEASNGEEALKKVASRKYDMVLLDISLPGRSGLDVLKQLNREQPALPVVMLSMYPEEDYAIRALSLGACGYLTKESASEEIEAAVQKVLAGGRYISPSLAETVAVHLGSGLDKGALPHDALSSREAQFLRMIGSGKTPSQIADELSLSIKTVSTYRSRVLTKLKLSNNAELIKYAIKHGLAD
ncbi:DNA-binding response regulator [Geomonas silvestris]|uniref:DNA-binding response regulator n=1 Tax=Geomonas silvestris TaxID=2740184 RepID=A0A6V8MDL8_9BACT|nr:response regulator transcription factor [Geomonas silvestris]GFO58086.1 DNA-binding response regulator [Geomonas silvestris]